MSFLLSDDDDNDDMALRYVGQSEPKGAAAKAPVSAAAAAAAASHSRLQRSTRSAARGLQPAGGCVVPPLGLGISVGRVCGCVCAVLRGS